MKFAFHVKMYQNRSDVMTRRACIACIINNLLSIKVKWLQKNVLVLVYLSNLYLVDFYSWMCRLSAHFRKVALQTAHFWEFSHLYVYVYIYI